MDSPMPATQMDFSQKSQAERERTEVDLFVEQCSSLYNLILDALHDLGNTDHEDSLQCTLLEEMASSVQQAALTLAKEQPDTEGTVQLRMHTINSAMEQLRLRKNNSDNESQSSRPSPSSEIRNWLQSVERRLADHEQRLRQTTGLTKLLADQQVLQLEIQSEGQAHITRLEQQLQRIDPSDSVLSDRKRLFVSTTRKRWHAVYLNSLSLQIRIEERITRFSESCESDCESECAAPPCKRARCQPELSSESEDEEDTLPFGAEEYESIMDGRNTATSGSVSSDLDQPVTGKWDSVQQDIGYSSGENSVHEALNCTGSEEDDIMRRKRIESSPVKSFYRTVPLDTDASDCEMLKARLDKDYIPVENNLLSDSMIVNYETMNSTMNGNEYDEVLRLMDDNDVLPEQGMNDSFHTQWREIRGHAPRRHRLSREIMEKLNKGSCDASSEDSSDCWDGLCEGMTQTDSPMSRSFTSNITDTAAMFGSLKRGRSARGLKNSSFLLECSEMEASFCSTRSEMTPNRNRGLRKRLKVRRMPRSMSDGEQLGFGTKTMPGTPHIKVSPPRTPLARSTRLLQRLDSALLAQESDTAPEQSDVAAYEWDDYKPPAKDESCDALAMAVNADELLSVDEDYNQHFGGAHDTLKRLINESRANLLIVAKSLEGVDDPSILRDIELISRTNIRQLDSAIKINGAGHINDVGELVAIREQWADLLERVSSPVPQIIAKFEKFTSTLRSMDQASSMHSLNGVSPIKSREDAAKALSSMLSIQDNLSSDRDELRSLLSSPVFKSVMGEHCNEFESISDDFDDAVNKIEGLVSSLRRLNSDWLAWTVEQQQMRETMKGIEDALRSGTVEQPVVLRELELCQERMNSLETMCNYLTSSVASLQDGEAKADVPDFFAEIRLYSNAFEQLKSKFNDLNRIPSPTMMEVKTSAVEGPRKRRAQTTTQSTQATAAVEPVVVRRPFATKTQLFLLFVSCVLALAALLFSHISGSTFGPHLTYVRGPPPT